MPQFGPPRKMFMCLTSWERTPKKGSHINFFRGIFGVKKRVPNGPFSATKTQRAQRSKKFDLDRNFQSRSKFLISLENSQSRCLDFPTKNRAAVGGSLETFILDRNFQSRSKSRIFFYLWALWECLVCCFFRALAVSGLNP